MIHDRPVTLATLCREARPGPLLKLCVGGFRGVQNRIPREEREISTMRYLTSHLARPVINSFHYWRRFLMRSLMNRTTVGDAVTYTAAESSVNRLEMEVKRVETLFGD